MNTLLPADTEPRLPAVALPESARLTEIYQRMEIAPGDARRLERIGEQRRRALMARADLPAADRAWLEAENASLRRILAVALAKGGGSIDGGRRWLALICFAFDESERHASAVRH